ncbi:hypothetical protein OC834_007318 [Tilletia horrida]|nr:hypothetical protein OC834_007318 [Tilletia horrida]KAK0542712.1 hypothetical protein OC844_007738 [Tilletia horrida]
MLYFIRLASTPVDSEASPSPLPETPCPDPHTRKLLQEFEAVFRESLPTEDAAKDIPGTRCLQQPIINTGDAKPVDIRAYGLTATQQTE